VGVRLTKELVRIDQVVGEESSQAIVEGVINLPDGKPNIERVISVEARLNTESLETDILDGKVIIEGDIDVDAMYVADVEVPPLQPVHFVEGTIDFSAFVKIPGARKNMDVRVKAKIEHVKHSFDPERPREIKVRMIVKFTVKVTQRVEIEIVVDATGPDDLQVLTKNIRIEDVIGDTRVQHIVKSDVSVPEGKPDIEEIIKVEAKARKTDVKIIDDKVIVEGVLEVGVLYVASMPAPPLQPVHFMEVEVPFTVFAEVPGARHHMAKTIRLDVEHMKGRRKDARTLSVEAIIRLKVRVFQTKMLDVVVDLFSPSKELTIDKTRLKVDEVIGEDENQEVIRDTLTVPEGKPDIEQIFKTRCRAEVTGARIIDDKVIVEGTLFIETLYVAQMPSPPLQPVHFMEHEIDFTTFVEIPGAKEHMTLDFDVDVEHCSATVRGNDPRKFDVRAILRLDAKVTRAIDIEVVLDVEEEYEDEEEAPEEEKESKGPEKKDDEQLPSMTIYIVQKGDTLWNIAKRYNVTVDSIVKANNIANPNSIMPGQQLVIPRRMF